MADGLLEQLAKLGIEEGVHLTPKELCRKVINITDFKISIKTLIVEMLKNKITIRDMKPYAKSLPHGLVAAISPNGLYQLFTADIAVALSRLVFPPYPDIVLLGCTAIVLQDEHNRYTSLMRTSLMNAWARECRQEQDLPEPPPPMTDSPVSDDDFAKEMEAIYGPLREELEKLKETGDPAFTACCDKLITYMVETKIAIVKQDVWGLHSMKSKAHEMAELRGYFPMSGTVSYFLCFLDKC